MNPQEYVSPGMFVRDTEPRRFVVKRDGLGEPVVVDTKDDTIVASYVTTSDTPNARRNAAEHARRLNKEYQHGHIR